MELRQELAAFAGEVAAKIESKEPQYGDSYQHMTLKEHTICLATEMLELFRASQAEAPAEAVDIAARAFLLWWRFRRPTSAAGDETP